MPVKSPPDHGLPYDPRYAPPDYVDPVIEALKKNVDRARLRENLKLTVEERIQKAQNFLRFVEEPRHAGKSQGANRLALVHIRRDVS